MAKVSPWSVKGVEPEAREAAKIAARRAGLTLGQWLNGTIRAAATRQLATPSRTSQDPISSELTPCDDIAEYSDHLATYGGRTVNGAAPYGMAYRAHPPAPTNEAIFENLINLSNRIEQTEMKTEAAVAPLADQVEQLFGQVEQVTEQVERVKTQATVFTAPVERAVQRLSERLEKIESSRKSDKDAQRRSIFGTTNN
jgi:localization factor PodJL